MNYRAPHDVGKTGATLPRFSKKFGVVTSDGEVAWINVSVRKSRTSVFKERLAAFGEKMRKRLRKLGV